MTLPANPDFPLCKNCAFYLRAERPELADKCAHDRAMRLDYVRGDHRRLDCESMRIFRCGPDGKLYQAQADPNIPVPAPCDVAAIFRNMGDA